MTLSTIATLVDDPEERDRLRALDALQILDTLPEAVFDDLAWLAGRLCDTPISLVTLVAAEHLWFKARCGLDPDRMPRKEAFCAYALEQDDILEIPDALLDERFVDAPPVTGAPHVRFYAGALVRGVGGQRFGTICVLDTRPRTLTDDQREGLRRLARRASEALETRRQRLLAQSREAAIADLLDVLPDGVVTCDAAGALREFNATSRDWHGVDARRCPPEDWARHFGLYDERGETLLEPERIPLARAWKGERVRGQTIVIRTPNRPPRTVSCNATPLLGGDGGILGAVCTMHDVTVQIRFAQLMEKMALTDELTGLPNRTAWVAELDRAVAWVRRSDQAVAVMFMDLDNFKHINDAFGHAAGDEVLRQFSLRLKATCRKGDFIARLSGDEFVVCSHGLGADNLDPEPIARRIHQAMATGVRWEGRTIPLACSIGFAMEWGPEIDAGRLMDKADRAMYVAKRDPSLAFSATLEAQPGG
ncbi:MAG TPA: diguanylate cyclase [Variovorax sp.]|nr:diguanylate cyclase [Variovorax sp.]